MGKSIDGAGRRPGIMRELALFLWERKLWWMMPGVLVLLLLAVLILSTQSSTVGSFVYTLF